MTRLDRHLELLARDELLELGRHLAAVGVSGVLVDDHAEGVDHLTVKQDVDPHQLRGLHPDGLVVEAGVALGTALELVEEVDDHLGEG